jgi:hypothetical protein
MLPLLLTVLATAYFVVPELLSRFFIGLFLVRKIMTAPRAEQLMKGVFWALFPLIAAWYTRDWLFFRMPPGSAKSASIVFGGLYSESTFAKDPAGFYLAFSQFASANLCLLLRTYVLVILVSVALGMIARNFGVVRKRLRKFPRLSKAIYLAVLPRISEWHLGLSPMLLEDHKLYSIEVDVMTKSAILYRGSVSEKNVGADGNLQTLILTNACRFLHADFLRDRAQFESLEDKSNAKKPSTEKYWRKVPGVLFFIVGSDITSVNIRHMDQMSSVKPSEDLALQKLLREINTMMSELTPTDAKDVLNDLSFDIDAADESDSNLSKEQ